MWIESAARHLLKREFLEPDYDEARGQVVARERVTFLGLVLSANRIVNYGPIAPEESRHIFAREALVYGRLQRRPEWVQANDAAIRAAEQVEERLRVRNLVQPPEFFVGFYAERLPRQVSSSAALEHFTRHLSEPERQALALTPEQIFARAPDAAVLERFPENVHAGGFAVPVGYRFAPGEAVDGATLQVPLLALPTLTRAEVDAAVPGLVEPRVNALLRSLPKEARRDLIPIAGAAQDFLAGLAAPSADLQLLANWLRQARGIAAPLVKFDLALVPGHLVPRVSVIDEGRELASGSDLAELRRSCATAARRRLEEYARRAYPDPWRRFDAEELPQLLELDLPEGRLAVFPTLAGARGGAEVRFEWSAVEAASIARSGACHLAQAMLERQTRDLKKSVSTNSRLILGASPYFGREALADLLLELAFRRACFEDEQVPRTRAQFEAAVDKGRAELHPALEAIVGTAEGWFTQAREVRRLLEDPRARRGGGAGETEAHLARLLSAGSLSAMSSDWLRHVTRYLKAEERRWQRVLARGPEPAPLLAELEHWTSVYRALKNRLDAESRDLPELEELRLWTEEYRVSLYAQELKTSGPVSAARLAERAAHIESWLAR
jgi:ATP-dependent helicase HrpA